MRSLERPARLAMTYALWTRAAVAELIDRCFDVRLKVPTMGKYLARWGCMPQKPMKKAYEQRHEAAQAGLDTSYPIIASRAKLNGAHIQWGDESGLRGEDVRGKTLAPRGQTPVVSVPNRSHNLSIVSSVINKGQMRWQIFDGALNATIIIGFLKRLIKNAKKKIFLTVDNLRVHHSKPVKAWLQANKDCIEIFHRSSCSPALNLDEMANADIKQAVTKLTPARTKLQPVKATISHLCSVQKQPERVRRYFLHDPVKYAA